MIVPTVIKVGGAPARVEHGFQRIGAALAQARARAPFVVIPGGGPFADQVRALDSTAGLPASTAHWMAILAMDQYGHALAAHTMHAELVEGPAEIAAALQRGAVPILVPYRWLKAADELPHSWDVTSDSLAAYLAGLLGAEHLILIKPAGGSLTEVADPYLSRATPFNLRVSILPFAELDRLPAMLASGTAG